MEWYREQTIQLIELFRARPALWDTSSVHYRNKRMKNEALEQISHKLKCPKEEIAKKICTLRVQFSRENVKVKRAREAGTVSYNPKWFGYQLLSFLNDQSRYTSMPPSNTYSTASAVESGFIGNAAIAQGALGTTSSVAQNVSIKDRTHIFFFIFIDGLIMRLYRVNKGYHIRYLKSNYTIFNFDTFYIVFLCHR